MARPSLTVFVIDDDDSVRKAVMRLIETAGWVGQTFARAEEFLEAELPPPDCLILDVRMPGGMSGLELQQHLSVHGPCVPIVFITGHEDEPTRDSAMAAGAVAFLTKPFDAMLLLDAVASSTFRSPEGTVASETQPDVGEGTQPATPVVQA